MDRARSGTRVASPGLVLLGRLGYACKGVVYVLIGFVAGQAALGRGGDTTDAQGVLARVIEAPFGGVLLGLITVGLAGYALWRFAQAALDTERKGTDAKGLWVRGGYAVSGAIHTLLALLALRLVQGNGGGSGGDASTQDGTARLMEQPFGPALVALVGLGMLGVAGFQLYRAYKADFREKLRSGEMSTTERDFATRTGRLGYAARGITFGTMGLFLVVAGLRQQPGEARGLAGALDALAQQPYGPVMLALVAAGLVAYGLYMFVEARYRRMVVP